ncbi:MAG: oxidoreductase [Gemmatimonadota bacterium]|nr:oxidoreductase [Gemmatimonadota bacterium]
MTMLALAIGVWGLGALGALLARGRASASVVGALSAVAGGAAASAAGVQALVSGAPVLWHWPWAVPAGALMLRLDPMAGAFLLPVGVIGALGAVYGAGYLRGHGSAASTRVAFAAYNVLCAGMALVVTANHMLLLIVAWEGMTLSSWVLVVHDHAAAEARAAGVQYLVAGHLATAAILLLALVMAAANGSFAIAPLAGPAAVPAGLLFVLALVGFGTKAGIVPAHVWLPDAHASAPSHVSALMSGVMITMGFYGLARFLPLLGVPAAWWGYVLVALGAAGLTGGILFSLAQRDVKRALAYSTVENAGLATLGIGLGVLGAAWHDPILSGLGWTAALLHLWNHALAKSVLFLGFGAAAQRAGSRDLDALGGLLARWRWVGSATTVGAGAIAALPGLNVFVSEWLLLRALFGAVLRGSGAGEVVMIAALIAVVMGGAIALAAFARLVGVALLGAPRTPAAASAPEPGWTMRAPLIVLAAACAAVAAAPVPVTGVLAGAVALASPLADTRIATALVQPLGLVLPALVLLGALTAGARAAVRRAGARRYSATWGCGYGAPSAAMQYGSTSFGSGITAVFQPVLQARIEREAVPGGGPAGALWPVSARWASVTDDPALRRGYRPLFARIGRVAARVRGGERARVTTSVLYLVAALVLLLGMLFVPGIGA